MLRFSAVSQKLFNLLSLSILASSLFLQGCASFKPSHTLPANMESDVQVAGFPGVRSWGDVRSAALEKSAVESIKQERAHNHGNVLTKVEVLALSGGGEDGAFGAGVVYGWSKAGTRPEFKVVTGISTGALIAPFAFLSPTYDEKMKVAYTSMSDKDIYKPNSIFSILLSLVNMKQVTSMADSQPLANLIGKLVDARMLRAIAAEHRKGRRLLVGTTQLDAQRLVIWDMGAIAVSHQPGALKLFHKIMLASASIPATFPPQMFDVEANGKKYQEMHVDGGVTAQTMLFENALYPFSELQKMMNGQKRDRVLYIIRNDKVLPQWEDVPPQLKNIAIRSIGSLIRSQGIGDFYRLYAYAQRYNIDYNLAFIPPSFKVESTSEFDTHYMRKLFALGSKMGREGYPWYKQPPGFGSSPDDNR